MMKTSKKIVNAMHRAIMDYDMLSPGDKVCVGLSGGKDSLTLLASLWQYKKQVKFNFEIVAVAVDVFGDTNYSSLEAFCQDHEIDFVVERTNIKQIVFDERKEKNPCSLCANLRRGVLNSTAKKLGCNKVALGHHADDLIQTFFMSISQENRLSIFWPKAYLSRQDITVIRPLIYVWEKEILPLAENYPVIQNTCPANKHSNREKVKQTLENLEKEIPNFKLSLHRSLCAVERYNLLDKCKRIKNEN